MPDTQLAKRIYDQVTAHPDNFEMGTWFDGPELMLHPTDDPIDCGTTMCVAGWACHLSGYALINEFDGVKAVTPDGTSHPVGEKARQLLDLPDVTLFHTDEPVALEMLRQIIDGRDLSYSNALDAVIAAP